MISTPLRDWISSLNFSVEEAIPSVSSPASSNSVVAPRILIEIVLNAVPTDAGSWTTLFAAVINPMVCESELFAALMDDADLLSPSKSPFVAMGWVLLTSFTESIILLTSEAFIPNPFKVEIIPSAEDSWVISSPTFCIKLVASDNVLLSFRLYPNLFQSAVLLITSLIVAPYFLALSAASFQ